ncbi:putative protein gravitropic in the light 1 [Helianthus anomalus]
MHHVVALIGERQKGTCTNRPLSRLLSVMCLVSKTYAKLLSSRGSHWKQPLYSYKVEDLAQAPSQIELLQTEVGDFTSCIHESDKDTKKESELLWRRVKTTTTLLTYLESKARILTVPHLDLTSCGIKQSDDEGFIDRTGTPMSSWSKNVNFFDFDCREAETSIGINSQYGLLDEQDASYMGEMMNRVQTVTDVMECLVKKVLVAELESNNAKQKVSLGQEEIKKKSIQIETMSEKLDEMDRFASGTNSILN